MTDKLQRLELTWPGKEDRFNPEPRILLEDKEKSYSAPDSLMQGMVESMGVEQKVQPTFDNMLIHGDNLLALKALEQDYAGKVKCIYIDPPYNTGNAFEHYDDGLEHSIWLSLMRDRLEILQRLLSDDGAIFISIDDNEHAYLKVLMDEIFGRKNFITTITVVSDARTRNYAAISPTHEYIMIYAKSGNIKLYPSINPDKKFQYQDEKGGFDLYELRNRNASFNSENRPNLFYPFYLNPNKKDKNELYEISLSPQEGWVEVLPQKSGEIQTVWRQSKETVLPKLNNIVFGKASKNGFQIVKKYREIESPFSTVWADKEVLSDRGTLELKALFGKKAFDYPKPEGLIQKVLTLASKPGDLVLDSFLGSGTTAAVAHKMGRRWIGVEMGDQVYTHCLPRLKKVINGEDAGGVTKSTGWLCGGGFKFYELASSLIVKDKYGQQIISDKYNADMLAEAMCKILGYHYKPDSTAYWKQGYSSEKSFIYTTTFSMQEASLERLHEEVGDNNLLVCCSAFSGNSKAYPNISVKKIPAAILKKCEWGREGYPLNLTNYHPDDKEFEFDEENDE